MIFDGNQGHSGKYENNYWLLGWTLGNMCSIAVFNWAGRAGARYSQFSQDSPLSAGITVAKKVDATTRAVLDQLRTVIIWAVFIIPFGPALCRVQQYFHFTAVRNQKNFISFVFLSSSQSGWQ